MSSRGTSLNISSYLPFCCYAALAIDLLCMHLCSKKKQFIFVHQLNIHVICSHNSTVLLLSPSYSSSRAVELLSQVRFPVGCTLLLLQSGQTPRSNAPLGSPTPLTACLCVCCYILFTPINILKWVTHNGGLSRFLVISPGIVLLLQCEKVDEILLNCLAFCQQKNRARPKDLWLDHDY